MLRRAFLALFAVLLITKKKYVTYCSVWDRNGQFVKDVPIDDINFTIKWASLKTFKSGEEIKTVITSKLL